MRTSRSCWNGTTSALQPEEITLKGTRVSCVYYCDGKSTKIPKRDFIFARVKTGQVGT